MSESDWWGFFLGTLATVFVVACLVLVPDSEPEREVRPSFYDEPPNYCGSAIIGEC